VALDEQTAPIADNIGNFSKWVRGRLIAYDNTTKAAAIQILEHNAPRTLHTPDSTKFGEGVKVCFPFSEGGCCVLCWPDGPPTRGAWFEWSHSIREGMIHTPKPEGGGWHFDEIDNGTAMISRKKKSKPKRRSGFWSILNRRWFKES